MQTSGVVFDFYDDMDKGVLKRAFPTADRLPDAIKTAHILRTDERLSLRDEAYALVMVNEGHALRKFACIDPGNTALSVVYFLANGQKLPGEAQKVAAANILSACDEFGLPRHPLLEKIASGEQQGDGQYEAGNKKRGAPTHRSPSMGRTRDPARQPPAPQETDWVSRTNLKTDATNTGEVARAAEGLHTSTKTAGVDGGGETLTTDSRHVNVNAKYPNLQNTAKSPDHGAPLEGTPGAPLVNARVVDVTGKSPKQAVFKKTAERTALNGKYALDSYEDVQRAVLYFGENYQQMDPPDRHVYAVKTAARAGELGIEITDIMDRYGSVEYADDVDAHVSNRASIAQGEDAKDVYEALLEKRASIDPEKFAEILGEADILSGLNWQYGNLVADPYYATFGGNALRKEASWTWAGALGDQVSAEKLVKLSKNRHLMLKSFSPAIVDGFQQDPVKVFESMPETQKILFSRMANSVAEGL